MALFMSREELEAIRPAHVSMGRMRAWYYAKRTSILAFAVLVITVPLFPNFDAVRYVTEAAAGATILGAVCYFGVLLLWFARYSLRSLLRFVLLTGALSALFVLLDTPYRYRPVLVAAFIVALLVMVQLVSFDPERQAKRRGQTGNPSQGGAPRA